MKAINNAEEGLSNIEEDQGKESEIELNVNFAFHSNLSKNFERVLA